MRYLLGRLLPALLLALPTDTVSNKEPPELPPHYEAIQCVEGSDADIDGDGKPDRVCITHPEDEDPQRATVILSSAPPGSPPALDLPILDCPSCITGVVIQPEISVSANRGPPASVTFSQSSGRVDATKYEYQFERSGTRFKLVREDEDGLVSSDIIQCTSESTMYKDGIGESKRYTPVQSVEFLSIYALPLKSSITVDGNGSEAAWRQALKVPVDSSRYVIFQRNPLNSDADLSYTLRALWDTESLYLLVEVTDDVVLFAPPDKSGVRYDHLEVWFSHEYPFNDCKPQLQPNPENTFQFGLVPDQKTNQVRVMRWFPEEERLPQVVAAYRRSAKGYVIEARIPLGLLGIQADHAHSSDRFERSIADIGMTVVVSDADVPKAPRQEKMLATSRLEHRGAPFEMGVLHLMKAARPDDLEHLRLPPPQVQ